MFCCLCLVEVMKLNLGRDSEVRFGQDFEVVAQASFLAGVCSAFSR